MDKKTHTRQRLAAAFVVLFLSLPAMAQNFHEDSLKVGGEMRHFVTYLPSGLKPDAPTVFVLHGYGGGIWRENPMIATAQREGFAVCIPQGLRDPKGKPSWNVGYPFQEGWKVDDVKALCSIARYVQKRHGLSKKNTFLTGMSNGGEMCYLMAYSNQKTFKAVAPIAGLTMLWMYNELNAKKPMPVLEIHGTEDRTSEWFGDIENKGGWGAYIAVPLAVGFWATKNRCRKMETERMESLNPKNGRHIIKHRFTESPWGADVWLYEVVGGKHTWHTEDINTADEIWKFFSKFLE